MIRRRRILLHWHRGLEVFRCLRRVRRPLGLIRRFLGFGGTFPYEIRFRNGSGGAYVTAVAFEDVTTVWAIYCRSEYYVPEDCRLILDLGANIGLFTIHATGRATAAHVVCAEPFPTTFARLCQNVSQNGLRDRVTCLEVAIAAEDCQTRAMTADDRWDIARNLISPSSNGSAGVTVLVRTRSLDTLIDEACRIAGRPRIDLLKLDVEGAEYEAFAGAADRTLDKVDAIQMEYHPGGDSEQLINRLESAGFRRRKHRRYSDAFGIVHLCRA